MKPKEPYNPSSNLNSEALILSFFTETLNLRIMIFSGLRFRVFKIEIWGFGFHGSGASSFRKLGLESWLLRADYNTGPPLHSAAPPAAPAEQGNLVHRRIWMQQVLQLLSPMRAPEKPQAQQAWMSSA